MAKRSRKIGNTQYAIICKGYAKEIEMILKYKW